MNKNLNEFYTSRANNYKIENQKYTTKTKNINIWRGITFFATVGGAMIIANFSILAMTTIIIVGIIIFAKLVLLNAKYTQLQQYFSAMQTINENELKAIENDNSPFDCGIEYIDPKHDYTYDLDIFGKNSIFQKLNRCATGLGKNLLAHRLKNPFLDANEIIKIQQTTQQLENEVDTRQNFLAESIIQKADITPSEIDNISKSQLFFSNKKWLKVISIIIILITNTLVLLSFLGKISFIFPAICYAVQFFIVSAYSKHTNALSEGISQREKIFAKYQNLFKIIEETTQKSEYIKKINDKANNGKKISLILKELQQISKLYSYRLNLVFTLIAQGFFMYDIFINLKFENWLKKYATQIPKWFELTAQCDFLFSLATLKFNNKDWCFPVPKNQEFLFNAQNAGHPLINNQKCVKNNINFSNKTYLQIITGANMAGKSTYLRTVGVNLVLAQIGAAVCAQSFEWKPIAICTSIRTSDSVQDNESYFFAELKRLQRIVNRLETGETLFVIVDEMLRGTNSKDKHDGSQKFLLKLLKFNCIGLFATHDIDIGNMKKDFPNNIGTKCFEISFEGDKLIFDYTLKEGISKNLNASFLMKKMGITD